MIRSCFQMGWNYRYQHFFWSLFDCFVSESEASQENWLMKNTRSSWFPSYSPYLEDPQPLGPHCGEKVWRVSSVAAHRSCHWMPSTAAGADSYSQYDPCKISRQEGTPRTTTIFFGMFGVSDHPWSSHWAGGQWQWPYFHVDTLSPGLSPSPIDSLDGHPSICNCGCSVAAFLVHVHSDLGIGMLIPN